MFRKFLVILVVGLVLLNLGNNRIISRSGQVEAQGSRRALVFYDPSGWGARNDATEVATRLKTLGWIVNNDSDAKPLALADSFDGFVNEVRTIFGQPKDNTDTDILFFYSGHSGHTCDCGDQDEPDNADDNVDCPVVLGACEPECSDQKCDETIAHYTLSVVSDDQLKSTFQGYAARKIFIFDTCFAGGLFDGSSDLGQLPNTIGMAASESQEEAKWKIFLSHLPFLHSIHGVFSFYLIGGLKGAADGAYGGKKDGTITFLELFLYAGARTVTKTGDEQHPVHYPDLIPLWNTPVGNASGDADKDAVGNEEGSACEGTCNGETSCSNPVGGIAELPEVPLAPLETQEPTETNYGLWAGIAAAAAVGVIALGADLWFARRRGLSWRP
jgi:hypothetical protein